MNDSQKLLITGGLIIAIIGMCYGLFYALFDAFAKSMRIRTGSAWVCCLLY